MNNAILAGQLPFVDELELELSLLMLRITVSTIAPESSRTIVKVDASIALSPSAKRHSTEFAANAISASPVKRIVFIKKTVWFIGQVRTHWKHSAEIT